MGCILHMSLQCSRIWWLSKYHLFLASGSVLRVVWVCGRSSSVLVFMAAFCVLAMVCTHVRCGCVGVWLCGCVGVSVHALTSTQQHTGSVSTSSSKKREWNVSRRPLPLPEWSEWINVPTPRTLRVVWCVLCVELCAWRLLSYSLYISAPL